MVLASLTSTLSTVSIFDKESSGSCGRLFKCPYTESLSLSYIKNLTEREYRELTPQGASLFCQRVRYIQTAFHVIAWIHSDLQSVNCPFFAERNSGRFCLHQPGGKAVLWLRRLVTGLSSRRSGFMPGSVHVEFVVDKVALGQVFLRVLLFSPVNIVPPWLSTLIYHLGDEQ
jgi:hypothetical protein